MTEKKHGSDAPFIVMIFLSTIVLAVLITHHTTKGKEEEHVSQEAVSLPFGSKLIFEKKKSPEDAQKAVEKLRTLHEVAIQEGTTPEVKKLLKEEMWEVVGEHNLRVSEVPKEISTFLLEQGKEH